MTHLGGGLAPPCMPIGSVTKMTKLPFKTMILRYHTAFCQNLSSLTSGEVTKDQPGMDWPRRNQEA